MTPFLLFLSILTFVASVPGQTVIRDLTPYLQPNDALSGKYDSYQTNSNSLCTRRCNGAPKICYYRFIVELYDTMGPACGNCSVNNINDCSNPQCIPADGYEKAMISVNRMFPGPSIQVCKNDRVIVDLENRVLDKGMSIHWHGIRQIGTPYMDGVALITQCPVTGEQTFRYDFKVDTAGTFFWHSHSGMQKEDGVQGPLIVRDTEGSDFNRNNYDTDLPSHVVFVSDWLRTLADVRIPGLLTRNQGQMADSFLVNGKGILNPQGTPSRITPGMTPMAVFTVTRGRKYRFRFIGATCLDCSVEVSIQNHPMTLITTDAGHPVRPERITSLSLLAGDRFDVVVEASQPVGTYWMFVRGLGACATINQYALVRYTGSTQDLPPNNSSVQNGPIRALNAPNVFCNASSPNALCVSQLVGAIPPPSHITSNNNRRTLSVRFGFYQYTRQELFQTGTYNKFYIPVAALPPLEPLLLKALINNISNTFPPSPILTQFNDIPPEAFCTQRCYQGLDPANCNCLQYYSVPLGTTLTIVVTDTAPYQVDGLTHPFHLHGYDFYVLEMGVFSGDVDQGYRDLINRINTVGINSPTPPLKDTIGIPSGGYAVIAIYTDNPGYWLFHCHFLYHLEMGMGAILQTGDRSQMATPPRGFPRCNNFKPDVVA